MLVQLTTDQLAALAASLGLPSFPGADSRLLAELPAEHRTPVVTALLATLEADGLLVRAEDQVVVEPALAALVLPLLEGDTWLVERSQDQEHTTTLVGALGDVVVVHTATGSLHTLALAGALEDVLLELVDASSQEPQAARPVRHPRSGLPERAPLLPTVQTWRSTTTLQRLPARGGPALEKAGVLDGGPGRVWWVVLDPDADDALDDDPSLEAVPVGPDALAGRVRDWVLRAAAGGA